MAKTEMDNLLNEAQGDLAVIKKELGIPDEYWNGQISHNCIIIQRFFKP